MYEDHLKTCSYCQSQNQNQKQKGASSLKPTIYVKSRATYSKQKKLGELGAIIKGISYPSLEPISMFRTKGGSSFNKLGPIEREIKLKELGKLVRG